MQKTFLIALATACAFFMVMAPAARSVPAKEVGAIKAELEQTQILSGGILGAFALNEESSESIGFQENEAFPMASVVKLPIAIAFLKCVDEGKYALDDTIHLDATDLYEVGHSPLAARFPEKGRDLSYKDILRYSICESDTTAGEILLAKAGGPKAVQKLMDEFQCSGVIIKDSERNLVMSYNGIDPAAVKQWDAQTVDSLFKAVSESDKQKAAKQFLLEPGNTATPRAMAELLGKLRQGKLLKPDTTTFLWSLLEQTQTFPNRLRGLLPKGTIVAHKTGTWATANGVNAATNDAGTICLPEQIEHICVVVFVKGSTKPLADRERAIANFAKYAYDALGRRKR